MTTMPRWYRPDRGLESRMVLTMFLIGLLYVVFVFVLGELFHGLGFGFFAAIALIIAFVQFFYSDKIALWSMRAHIVSAAEAPELHEMIGRLAQQANLPMPKVAIAEIAAPNAFATGRNQRNAVVCVTRGILNRLSPAEMEAVLAHELTHIVNRDILVMTIANFLPMLAALIMRSFFYSALFGGFGGGFGGRRGNNDNGGAIQVLVLLFTMVVYFLSFLLVQGLSRYREYAADRGSALITGQPRNLASALMHISGTMESGRIPNQDLRTASAVSALCIMPMALKGDEFAELFSSHPSLQHRIEKLQQMEQQIESAPARL
jgi:heat shock protein HtpX